MRVLLSSDIPCKGGCKYCFAKWSSYEPLDGSSSMQLSGDKEELILYPCCDGDCFYQANLTERIMQLSANYQKVYVSISSKLYPSDGQINQWRNLHQWLVLNKKGFLKFAISISNRSMLNEIEPQTMLYEDRLKLALKMKEMGIPVSLTLKPVLPFISEGEYRSILEDFSPFLRHVLLGGLYVDKAMSFYSDYLGSYSCAKRKVNWLPQEPEWDYIEDPELMNQIKRNAEHLGMQVFMSDKTLIEEIAREYK